MKTNQILPGQIIGIIGGGQLAYYMAIEALNMGYQVKVYDPNPDSPAKRISDFTCASFDDYASLENFCSKCDVITYEFENMNLKHIQSINDKFNLPQGSKILKYTAHRFEEIKMAKKLGIPVVKSVYLEKSSSDQSELKNLQLPLIIKTCRFGYDGKGQSRIQRLEDLKVETEVLVSELISFDKEISILLVRTTNDIFVYPCLHNVHKNGILHTSETLDKDLYPVATEYAKRIAEEMDYIGIMAVEFFVKDGQLIFNEVAPRPHNSGHLTLTVANKSQFKAHIEAICGFEVGELYYHENAIMLNILGQDLLKSRTMMNQKDTYHYEYGKTEIVHNRKMGHIVFTKNTKSFKNTLRELGHE